MGTSTVQRSPDTSRWRIVNNLYEQPEAPVTRILAELFNAADSYSAGLGNEAVLVRVEHLLAASQDARLHAQVDLPTALQVSREAISAAQDDARSRTPASFYGDLADRALHQCILGAVRDPVALSSPQAALGSFLQNLVGTAIDYLVGRDLGRHLGGRRIVDAQEAIGLKRDIVEGARRIVATSSSDLALEQVARSPRERWPAVVSTVWAQGASLPAPGGPNG